jgi:hypothetical protein
VAVNCKEETKENLKENHTPLLWFKKSSKFDNSQDYAQKPQRNCTFMNLVIGLAWMKI